MPEVRFLPVSNFCKDFEEVILLTKLPSDSTVDRKELSWVVRGGRFSLDSEESVQPEFLMGCWLLDGLDDEEPLAAAPPAPKFRVGGLGGVEEFPLAFPDLALDLPLASRN